ncbi:glucoamylase family protein [Marivirga sp.]|uniref:glucoamylase family protein n=1 Tax=Marivirga sp. TaxID=2018662 RepID=UPI002D80E69F|nr:glucoamylase family protein [Marivirga sp.]HET8859553.1 glucoamylase family protein [Marivirga sp.]
MLKLTKYISSIIFILLFCGAFSSCKEESEQEPIRGLLQLRDIRIGTIDLVAGELIEDAPFDRGLVLEFSDPLNRESAEESIMISTTEGNVALTFSYLNQDKSISALPENDFQNNIIYTVTVDPVLSTNNKEFPGATYQFQTQQGEFSLMSAEVNGTSLESNSRITNVPLNPEIILAFDQTLDPQTNFDNFIFLTNNGSRLPLTFQLSEDQKTLQIQAEEAANDLARYNFRISNNLTSEDDFEYEGYSKDFYTQLDSTYKFDEISDEQLLTKIQSQTFKYFWDFAHPNSGLARERNTSGDLVTIGGSGFGLMAIIVGIERGFITRTEGVNRFEKIVNFLADADRFHGVWPHWMNGNTGATIPFSNLDNGADLVETAFMIQGLLTVRQYLNETNIQEQAIINQITTLWEEVEWDWFTKGGEDVLYWHWSPQNEWAINLPIRGWNESLIIYVLAASSPTHPIEKSVYDAGWARNGGIINGNSTYGINMPLGENKGGPLFFAHYSFLALDPRNLQDQYANYWEQNQAHSLINQAYVMENPKNFVGYGESSWGLTASDNHEGYSAHSPSNDLGVITPTAAISSIPYTPEESMKAIRHFYYLLGDRLWGEFGFYDAFNVTEGWYADSYLAIDQGPIITMIENHRTALLWEIFMQDPDVQNGLNDLGFTY